MHTHLCPYIQCTDVTTSVLTTFRSDNCNGIGEGGMVFAYAVPSAMGRRSVHQSERSSEEAPSKWLKAYCRKYWKCKNYPCVSGIHSKVLCHSNKCLMCTYMCFTLFSSPPPYMQECYTNTSQRIVSSLLGLTEPHR